MVEAEIQTVPWRSRGAAIRFLVGRDDSYRQTRAGVQTMRRMLDRFGPAASRFWRVRSGRKTLAVALVVECVGKTAMLFFSPPDAPGVDRRRLVGLIDKISDDAIDGGMSLTQALIDPQDIAQVELLTDSGLMLLAELIYMKRDLLSCPPPLANEAHDGLVWRNFTQFTQTELADVISRTYADSLDCPRLRGVRQMPDVIAGHKCGGVFCPESWWIVSCPDHATPVGCILVNDSATGMSSDIIYMGVASEFRRRGLALAMLDRAVAQAAGRNRHRVTVAVDKGNDPAMKVYQQRGFVEIHRRVAFVKLKSCS